VQDTPRFAVPPAEVIGLGVVPMVGALQVGGAAGVVAHATLATALPLSPFVAVAMTRYVQVAAAGRVKMLYEPCEGATQPASPLTDHWYDEMVAVPGHWTATRMGWPGSTVGDDT
jgi:hypothetical protein